MSVNHRSILPTLELDFSIWVFFRSSRVSFLVFIVIFKLFSVFVVAFGISTKYISAVAGMLNRLAEYVRLVFNKDDIVNYNAPACFS